LLKNKNFSDKELIMKQHNKKKAAFLLTLAFCAVVSASFAACSFSFGESSSDSGSGSSTSNTASESPSASENTSVDNSGTPASHNLKKVEAKEATCTEAGNGEYWVCQDADGKIFSDEEGEYELSAIPAIKALGHDMQYAHDETEHWQTCSRGDSTTEKSAHEYALTVSAENVKTTYNLGDTFNAEGLVAQEDCKCGATKTVETAQIRYSTAPLTLADTSVEISVGDQKTSVPVTVNAPVSITATLKSGVVYYNNGKANPTSADFEVTATFADESTATLSASNYTVTPKSSFALNGGEIAVKCGSATTTVNATLTDVVATSIAVTKNPDKLSYTAGDTFAPAGMVVTATYNDGSTNVVTEYTYSTDELTVDDTTVTITYEGLTADVTISVAEGTVAVTLTSLQIADGLVVYAGEKLDETAVSVYGVYSNGNRELLNDDQYTLELPERNASLGDVYTVKAIYSENTSVTATANVTVRIKLEGEDGTIVGGSKATEIEGIMQDGAVVATGNNVSFAGNFANAVLSGKESSLTLTFVSQTDSDADITLRCGNGYLTKDSDGNYWMQALKVNTILDITVNGKAVTIGDDVILSGSGPANTEAGWRLLYRVFYTFTIQDVAINAGVNEIKLTFKTSTEGAQTCWSESPSSMNIDYLYIDTKGSANVQEGEIQSIALDVEGMAYGITTDELTPYVVATYTDGARHLLDSSEYTLALTEGDISKGYIRFGEYTFTATLKDNTAIQATYKTELEKYTESSVTKAYLLQDGDKVYYVLEFNNVGYEDSDYEFFNGGTIYTVDKTESTPNTMTFYFDVTDWTSANSLWPHLRIAGEKYVNGANTNGDIRGSQLEITEQTITVNGKTYKLATSYSMPVLTIS
jgi:hypothetical protein